MPTSCGLCPNTVNCCSSDNNGITQTDQAYRELATYFFYWLFKISAWNGCEAISTLFITDSLTRRQQIHTVEDIILKRAKDGLSARKRSAFTAQEVSFYRSKANLSDFMFIIITEFAVRFPSSFTARQNCLTISALRREGATASFIHLLHNRKRQQRKATPQSE